jgi:hypothetical protein
MGKQKNSIKWEMERKKENGKKEIDRKRKKFYRKEK